MNHELLQNPIPKVISPEGFVDVRERPTPFGPAVLVSDLGTPQYKNRNEDRSRYLILPDPLASLKFVVIDGMGGSKNVWDKGLYLRGDEAAQAGLEAVISCFTEGATLDQIPAAAHNQLRERDLQENGVVGCFGEVERDTERNIHLRLIGIGDVGAYVFREGKVIPLTEIQRTYRDGTDYISNYISGDHPATPSPVQNFVLLTGDILIVCTDGVVPDNLSTEEVYLLTKGRSISDSLKILDVALQLKMEKGLPNDVYRNASGQTVEEVITLLKSQAGSPGSQPGKPDNRTLFMLVVNPT